MFQKFNSKEEVVDFLSKVKDLENLKGKFSQKDYYLKIGEVKPPEYYPKKFENSWYIYRKVYYEGVACPPISGRITQQEFEARFSKAIPIRFGDF